MLLARDHRGDRERAQELAAAARALSDELGMQALSGNVARLMRSEASVQQGRSSSGGSSMP